MMKQETKDLKNLKTQIKQEIEHQKQKQEDTQPMFSNTGSQFTNEWKESQTNSSFPFQAANITSPSAEPSAETQALELKGMQQTNPSRIHVSETRSSQNLSHSQFGQMVRQNIQNRLPKLEDELKDTEREQNHCDEEEFHENEEQCEEEEQSPLFPFK